MAINYKYAFGDSISGERITGWAGRITPKKIHIKNGIKLKTLEFFLGAECLVIVPITIKPSSASNNSVAEGLRSKKIYGEGEDYSRFLRVNRTSGHTHLQTTLQHHAFCVINIPISSRR